MSLLHQGIFSCVNCQLNKDSENCIGIDAENDENVQLIEHRNNVMGIIDWILPVLALIDYSIHSYDRSISSVEFIYKHACIFQSHQHAHRYHER